MRGKPELPRAKQGSRGCKKGGVLPCQADGMEGKGNHDSDLVGEIGNTYNDLSIKVQHVHAAQELNVRAFLHPSIGVAEVCLMNIC